MAQNYFQKCFFQEKTIEKNVQKLFKNILSKKFQKYQIFFFQKIFSNEISEKLKVSVKNFQKTFKKGSEIIQKIFIKKIQKVSKMFVFQTYFSKICKNFPKTFFKTIFLTKFKIVLNIIPKKFAKN